MPKNDKYGFTLIELMVSISILLIVIGVVLQQGDSLKNEVELENAGKNVDLAIKKAKTKSIGAVDDKNYGVHFEASKVVIFDGTGIYDDGASLNETYILPSKVEIYNIALNGGVSDLYFERLIGNTSNYGSIGLRIKADTSKTRTIFINSNGQNSLSAFGTSAQPAITNARHAHYNLSWNIADSTNLILRWYDISDSLVLEKQIGAAPYFNAEKTQFDWRGTINESGINQELAVRSWKDGVNSVICVTRYSTENDKLKIYFYKAGEKHIATYENTGSAVTATAGADGGTLDMQ